MGFLDSLYNSTIGAVLGLGNTALDSLGLSQHGRDQYFTRDMQREFLNTQIFAQSDENQKNRDFSLQMYEKQMADYLKNYPELLRMQADEQFNLWKNQFTEQNEYNDPRLQVQRQMAAGLFPSGQSGITSGVNQMGSSASVTPPPQIHGSPLGGSISPIGLPQGMSASGQTLRDFSGFLRDVATARKTGKESDRFDEITDAMVEKLWQEASNNEAMAAYNGAKTVIERALGKDAKRASILKDLREAMYYGAKEDTEKALKLLHQAETWLSNTKNQTLLEELPYVQEKITSIIDYLDSSSQRNRAESNLAYAKAITEQDLRHLYSTESGYYSELRGLINVDRVEKYATMPDRIRNSMETAEQAGLISQEMHQEVDKLMRENDWIEVNQMLRIINTGLEGYRIGRFANAFDARNAIEERYNDFRMEHYGDTEEIYTDSGMDSRGHKVTRSFTRHRASQ